MRQWFADETEFANRGKLTWQTGKLNDRLGRSVSMSDACLSSNPGPLMMGTFEPLIHAK
jgi:hypothetical protein